MILEEKYKNDALKLSKIVRAEGKAEWRSPSNIALIKYWGKYGNQFPKNPSLSFGLDQSYTETSVVYSYRGKLKKSDAAINFTFDGKPNLTFETRVKEFLMKTAVFLPFINYLNFEIASNNSFPHSSGIASSASSMSALALCLVTIEQDLYGTSMNQRSFLQKASFLSRLGSGSACRSVYDGFVLWGKLKNHKGSSNEAACKLNQEITPKFSELRDAILITSSEKKKISSSSGHQLMVNHPFAAARYLQAKKNLVMLLDALNNGDDEAFITIVENEALTLHAMMLSSFQGFTLLNENTWNIIHKIRKFRDEKNIFITFTLDAGPNVHLLYPENSREYVIPFIKQDLLIYCENEKWIDDQIGKGPVKL